MSLPLGPRYCFGTSSPSFGVKTAVLNTAFPPCIRMSGLAYVRMSGSSEYAVIGSQKF